jgi:hypothetical protein
MALTPWEISKTRQQGRELIGQQAQVASFVHACRFPQITECAFLAAFYGQSCNQAAYFARRQAWTSMRRLRKNRLDLNAEPPNQLVANVTAVALITPSR